MPKSCHFFFQNKNETYILTINKPNIAKKSKYDQYFFIDFCFHKVHMHFGFTCSRI